MPNEDFLGFSFVPNCGINETSPMSFNKGECVEVADYQNKRRRLVVYKDLGARVSVTSQDILDALERGDTSIPAIAVPKATVRRIK